MKKEETKTPTLEELEIKVNEFILKFNSKTSGVAPVPDLKKIFSKATFLFSRKKIDG